MAYGFGLLLVMPALDQFFSISNRFQSTENRQLKDIPAFQFPHVNTFIRRFDQYYKDNFGWRNALFYVYSRWKFRILGKSPLPEKVIVGKEGWFYLGNSYNRVVDQHRGLVPITTDSLQAITDNLTRHQRELAQKGIKLFVFIAPDSHTIYPEYIPDPLQSAAQISRLDVLKQHITRNTTIPFIDVRDTLQKAKRSHQVYYQTDTHWNDYGAMVGSGALLQRMRQEIPALPTASPSDYHIVSMRGIGGDLVAMLTLQEEIKDPIYYEIKPAPHRAARQIATVPNERSGFPSMRFTGPDNRLPKLLLIGDSFSHSMTQFIPGYFRESYFVRDNRLDYGLVQAEQPDVIVIEIVERNLGNLAHF
ncbi:hypothetical protein GCM10023189_06460 [Nibrella saemangeumensis]|uniref:AlgX/AlgJ SGNH hydrolase-like domain-containing protein n=2 Tax=Nibrella saemangeumensis TaxID=1084526 RepID=A0ABP8MFA1_9BACT